MNDVLIVCVKEKIENICLGRKKPRNLNNHWDIQIIRSLKCHVIFSVLLMFLEVKSPLVSKSRLQI